MQVRFCIWWRGITPLPWSPSPIWISKKFRLEEKQMAYNKAREEKKWRLWKEAEEKRLRGLGVNEDIIQKLRKADWKDFKVERRHYEHLAETDTYINQQATDTATADIRSVQDLLDDIENEELHRLLKSVDKLTLQIVIWKMDGYTSAEISEKLGISINAINFRIWHLRKKIKNIL